MMEARGAALVVETGHEPSVVFGLLAGPVEDHLFATKMARAAISAMSSQAEAILTTTAETLLGADLARTAGWNQVVLARLQGSEEQMLGALCLVDQIGRASCRERV